MPGAHEVLIRVAAAGVNRADILQRKGLYAVPEGESDVPGLEVSGEIDAIGNEVRSFKVGDKVCALLGGGGYGEYALAHEGLTLRAPENISLEEAASLPEAAATVYLNLLDLGRMAPGENVLIHGGTSGIGVIAIQVAHLLGARVFTTVGSAEKCQVAKKLGATAIDYTREDFVEILSKHNGAQLILDMVGGSYVQRNFQAAVFGARIVMIGFMEGAKAEANYSALVMKNLQLIGSMLRGQSLLKKYQIMQSVRTVIWPLIDAGKMAPIIAQKFSLTEAAAAHETMEQGGHIGKILLIP